MYIIRVASGVRDSLIEYLVQNGIHAGLRYYPCHLQPFFGHKGKQFQVTEQIADEILSIPLYTDLTIRQVRWIVSKIHAFFS